MGCNSFVSPAVVSFSESCVTLRGAKSLSRNGDSSERWSQNDITGVFEGNGHDSPQYWGGEGGRGQEPKIQKIDSLGGKAPPDPPIQKPRKTEPEIQNQGNPWLPTLRFGSHVTLR